MVTITHESSLLKLLSLIALHICKFYTTGCSTLVSTLPKGLNGPIIITLYF